MNHLTWRKFEIKVTFHAPAECKGSYQSSAALPIVSNHFIDGEKVCKLGTHLSNTCIYGHRHLKIDTAAWLYLRLSDMGQ